MPENSPVLVSIQVFQVFTHAHQTIKEDFAAMLWTFRVLSMRLFNLTYEHESLAFK